MKNLNHGTQEDSENKDSRCIWGGVKLEATCASGRNGSVAVLEHRLFISNLNREPYNLAITLLDTPRERTFIYTVISTQMFIGYSLLLKHGNNPMSVSW